MSQAPGAAPRIIVVGEDEIHELMRDCGAQWDVQHRVSSVGQMWDDLSGHRLDPTSVAVVFSATVFAGPGELETAVAAMAPAAATFVVATEPGTLADLLGRIRVAAAEQGADPDAPVHVLRTDSKHTLLDEVRRVLTSRGLPLVFPGSWPVDAGPLTTTVEPTVTWEPSLAGAPDAVALEAPVCAPEVPMLSMAPTAPDVDGRPVGPVAPVPPVARVAPVSPDAPATPPGPRTPETPAAATARAAAGKTGERHLRPVSDTTATTPVAEGEPRPVQADTLTKERIPGQVTIAVTSSKGGSGKSTTAMMLAAQIAQSSLKAFETGKADRPLKVVLVDMDTRDGQVASLMGRYVPTALNIRVQPRWDEPTILSNLVHDTKLGIDCLLAPVRPRTADDVGPEFYRHVIRMLKTTHDVVILDTSVNYLDPLISTVCLPEATAILFVTTLATTSVQGMARALREITEPVEHGGMGINRRRIGIVVNQSITEVGMDRDQVLQAALRVSIVGAIPLATKDVLTCTNFNRMHQLLEHPLLGPAYFKLARTCMPNAVLEPVRDGSRVVHQGAASSAQAAPATEAPVLAAVGGGAVAPAAAPAAPERRRSLFGRRG